MTCITILQDCENALGVEACQFALISSQHALIQASIHEAHTVSTDLSIPEKSLLLDVIGTVHGAVRKLVDGAYLAVLRQSVTDAEQEILSYFIDLSINDI